MKHKENEAVEANQKMDAFFLDSDFKNTEGNSEVETANLEIQEQFYENEDEDHSLPYHVDINNPPIKK
ncbi:hypothetical protein [Neobacillus soli]|uniref:hypothetical protein n=1 Tax=Neobacillus soli TaxID=220688 RepID=UPI0008258A2F|nr:hypothetical protein [Neobacillus soli]